MTTTFEGLRDILVEDYKLSPEALTPETQLEDIEIDSLGVIDLIFSLEDKFDITATDTGQNFKTLGDVANYIERLIAERSAGQATGTETRE